MRPNQVVDQAHLIAVDNALTYKGIAPSAHTAAREGKSK
jgi:hypothetical protein